MFDYYNKELTLRKSKVLHTSFINIKPLVINNHDRLTSYIRTSGGFVNSSHLLVRMLYTLSVSATDSTEVIIHNAESMSASISNAFRITSSYAGGTFHKDVLMDGCTECILLSEESFDTNIHWTELEPIEFLYHSCTNINFMLGQNNPDAIAMYKVNLPMLAYQYNGWLRSNSAENIQNFILKYPIWNSIRSYVDISVYNRFYCGLKDIAVPKDKSYNIMPLNDVTSKLDAAIQSTNMNLCQSYNSFGQVLNSLPLIFRSSALDLVNCIDTYSNRYTDWFDVLYNLPYLNYGLDVGIMSNKLTDITNGSKLRYELNSIKNSRELGMLPKQLSQHIIGDFLNPLDRNLRVLGY